MKTAKRKRTWATRFSVSGLSIQQRLPLLICLLLLSVMVIFSWTAYIGVKDASLKAGRERLMSLTGQLSSLFQQSAHVITTATHTAATQESILDFLRSDGKQSWNEATTAMNKLRQDTIFRLVELLNADRAPIFRSGDTGLTIKANLRPVLQAATVGPEFTSIGKIYKAGDSMYYPVVAAVMDEKKPLGYIVRWRLLHATPQATAQLSQLIGTKATLYVGNDDGSLWTDMIKPVSSPPINNGHILDPIEYSRDGKPSIAAAHPIANTHWIVLIEFPRQSILETANQFLWWIIIVGTVLITAGIFVAWLMSRNITRPLNKLTAATTAIAGGDYSPLVQIDRRDELGKLARAFNAMAVQIKDSKNELEQKVRLRTAQLENANKELEAFSYSVSHDLRAPLRIISGYSTMLREEYEPGNKEANRYLDTISSNAKMMAQLIDDLIAFSKMERKEVTHRPISMKKLAESCLSELLQGEQESRLRAHIDSLPACNGDQSMIKQVWMNLISNAVKYSSRKPDPCIEIGFKEDTLTNVYFVRDNGVGFDMKYAHKLFGVFQRLHHQNEFEGTGVGLALAKRIINKHTGEIWAEATPGQGAVFYFSLPKPVFEQQ
jgi:signal transduction histidine kinase